MTCRVISRHFWKICCVSAILWGRGLGVQALPVVFSPNVILRDAEIEASLHEFSDPLMEVAGISPGKSRIFLLNADEMNALSSIGVIMVVNTGLITRCDRVEELIAVLAHEIGHIKKHHVFTRVGAMDNAVKVSLIGLLGAGLIGIATGSMAPVLLGIAGGAQLGLRSFLSFTRSQESEADECAYDGLNALGWPSDGATVLFQKLKAERGPLGDASIVYEQTHPLLEERLRRAERVARRSGKFPSHFQRLFELIRMKIEAYTQPPEDFLGKAGAGSSDVLTYGKAIAYSRQGKIREALALLGPPLSAHPYREEFRVRLLLDLGEVTQADQAMGFVLQAMARKDIPEHGSLYYLAGRVKLALAERVSGAASQKGAQDKALAFFEKAAALDTDDPEPWHGQSIVWGLRGDKGVLNLMLAETAYRRGDIPRAKAHREAAQPLILKTSPFFIKLEDLKKHLLQEEN